MRSVYDLCLHLLSEAVYNAAHGAVLAQQCYPLDVGSEHPEHLVDIRRGIEVLRWYGLLHQQLHSGHAVYTELGQLAVFLRPAHGVVIVPAPDQGIGAELVPIAVVLEDFFFLCGVLYVLEGDPPLLLDGGVDHVHRIVDRLVVLLRCALHVDRAVQLSGLLLAGEGGQLADQAGAFLPGDEVRGLHRIHQQLQFRQLEQAGADEVAVLGALDTDDVHALVNQDLDVAVHTLAAGLDTVGFPELEDV